jgi:two-component system response regulator FlrC
MNQMITSDRRMLDLVQLARTVAQSRATVLIQGESGTGKEMMAQFIHNNSSRSRRPYVAINCAAIPESLLESELFGYERGAFTGAVTSKAGKFELASGGTILLDEISEMDVRLQAKLLRVIQEGEIDRVGGRRPIPVDVRILATTNRNLAECVKQGTFREDLFYRLNVVNITLPSLRDRMGDVKVLAEHYMKEFAQKNGKVILGFTDAAVQLLGLHKWPGNIREIQNVVERSVLTAKGNYIEVTDIALERPGGERVRAQMPHSADGEKVNWTPGQTLDDVERHVILEALGYHNGNRTHTARALGISIRTLRNKLSDYRRMGIRV